MKRKAYFLALPTFVLLSCGDSQAIGTVDPVTSVAETTTSTGMASTLGTTGTTGTNESGEGGSTDAPCAVEPVEGDCNPWCQDCAAGQKCTPIFEPPVEAFGVYEWVAKCVPVSGDGPGPGGPCEPAIDTDECNQGSACWGYADDMSVCIPLCGGTPLAPECAEGKRCALSSNNVSAFCVDTCNPLSQDCQGSGLNCTVASPDCDGLGCLPWGARDTPLCRLDVSQLGAFGDPCADSAHCNSGLTCVHAEDMVGCTDFSCCTPFCDLNDKGVICPEAKDGMLCLPAFQAGTEPPGLENVGICRLP